MQILVVEDEHSLSNAIKKILEQEGYFVDAVYDGADAVEYAEAASYDLLILDVMLPKMDGFEVVRTLRRKGIGTPILMLTASTAVRDKVAGLTYGADDYMTKPFDTQELLARVVALTRRKGEVVVETLDYADLSLDLSSALLSSGEKSVQLSHREFEVLKLFLYNPTSVITKETLIVRVWGSESDVTDNNVEVYVSFLRKKLKYLSSRVSIRNLQKLGYRLEVEEHA